MTGDAPTPPKLQRLLHSLAAEGLSARPPARDHLARRLKAHARPIARAYKAVSHLPDGTPLPLEAEWLLDNYYVIAEAVRQVRTQLPPRFYRQLPAVASGVPRAYLFAEAVLASSDCTLTETALVAAVRTYQQVAAFTTGELWAVPALLRLVALEVLRRLADGLYAAVSDRQAAVAAVAAARGGQHPRLPKDPSDAYAAAVWDAVQDETPPEAVRLWLTTHLADPPAVLRRESVRQATAQVSFGNAVTTLRLLGVIDWTAFFESVSLVEATLRGDPGGVYPTQDFPTRDRCRRAVEDLAKGSDRTETDVAAAAVAAVAGSSDDHVRGQVSWVLIGEGRDEFARRLNYRPPPGLRRREWVARRPGLVYAGLLGGFTLLALAVAAAVLLVAPWWAAVLLLVVATLPASELAVGLTNFVVSRTVRPRVLARREFKGGIPAECGTFVVMPTLVGVPEHAAELLERLELHHLSSPDPVLRFALLTDFTDAATETTPTDQACVDALLAGIRRLNNTYAADGPPRFFLFHRKRRWNAGEGVWMAWERKRGKLHEFNRLLRGKADTDFVVTSHPLSEVPRVRFVLTLDADTVLPRDAARSLIAALAHPLNSPRLSADGKRVVGGYAVLQPRVSFLYRVGFKSLFARAFAGSAGVDPYSAAASDTYMDLFARGTFTGKGLYDVDAFAATAGEAFPDDHVLSHDLIESNYARSALVTDVEVFDGFPTRYPAYAKREHRWIRGDWQLLPWLGARVPTPAGRERNPLPLLERWKVFDNLRRSLVPPAAVLLLVLGWLALPLAWAAGWTLLVVSPWLLPAGQLLASTARRVVTGPGRRSAVAQMRFDIGNTLLQAGLQLVFLADQARLAADAVARTLFRVYVTRRKLLEWETAAAAESRLTGGLGVFVRRMWPGVAIAAAVVSLLAIFAPWNLLAAGPLLLAWLFSPLVAYAVSRQRVFADQPLTAEQEAELRAVADKTWLFFVKYVGPEDHWLPPDNFQEHPLGEIAHRTSPTNIGLYLLVLLAADEMGYATREEVADRLAKAFDTLDKLERHEGHFFNWYETNTLRVLLPPYVSTVDSGNFLACLLALKNGLRAKGGDAYASLAERAERMAAGMGFRFLYNPDRELFSIGYNAATGRLDQNHYDLLASEACISSFLTVALGQVPRKHWFVLGRPAFRSGGHTGLVSWGGTMFEYLMPRLFLSVPPGALLDEAQRSAVRRQVEYGRECGRPWGVSESGFGQLDRHQVYQYQSFGVPGLGLKRGLDRDRVIAPYACLMAADVDAAAAVANFAALRAAGGEGPFGFYEAIDYSPDRVGRDGSPTVVRSYMAHHQGMGLLAIVNRLTGGLVRRWLRAEPAVRAAELLLEERVPFDAPPVPTDEAAHAPRLVAAVAPPTRRRMTSPHTPAPRTLLLSNGRYAVMVTNAGGGSSRWEDADITRWRADATADADGTFVYVRDRKRRAVWSAAYQPTRQPPDHYEVTFSLDKAEFRRVDGVIETVLEIAVAPDDDVEVRRLTLVNRGDTEAELDVTSYAEVVLIPHAADLAHPAFGKLFLETEWLPEHHAVICRRRPRSADQPPVFAVHVLSSDQGDGGVTCETDRMRFVGRRRTPADPAALDFAVTTLSNSVGPVLDPVFALRKAVKLPPGGKAVVAFTTGYAATREDAVAMADRYDALSAVHHGFDLAWAHARIELQRQNLKAEDVNLFQRLAGHLLYPTGPLRAPAEILSANRLGQSGLWAFGISGDLPILLLRIHGDGGLPKARLLLQGHAYWQGKGLKVDLVLLLENASGYLDQLHTETLEAVRAAGRGDLIDRPGGVFVRKGWQMADPERTLLLTAARVVLDDRAGALSSQAEAATPPTPRPAPRPPTTLAERPGAAAPWPGELRFDGGYGGFTPDGREFVVRPDRPPPLPWSNVIANRGGGFLVTDGGGGYVWAGNSQSNRLTPWSNDPVSDPPGDVIYIQDEDTGAMWSATPRPCGGPATVRHGCGYTAFSSTVGELTHELTVFAPADDAVKVSLLTLRNPGRRTRKLNVAYYAEWVLGTHREATGPHVVTRIDADTGAVFAVNPYHPDVPTHVAFADVSLRPRTVTGDRAEFLGRNGDPASPASFTRVGLSGSVGPGLDPCAALRGGITLSAGESRTLVFVLGQAPDEGTARRLIHTHIAPKAAAKALAAVVNTWDERTGAVTVETPDPAFDTLMNRWLIYQTLSCRVWGRSGFYQSGGAWGFRDQLQDVCALVHAAPRVAREHLLRAAARQFPEGDVQHWWHEPSGSGVRTDYSDDFLWLPYAVAHYVETTADTGVLEEKLPFLDFPPLKEGEHSVMGVPGQTARTASLFVHCQRALEHGRRLGEHGLPLMGGGDWNDGMNQVGAKGKGESVWLAWFQAHTFDRFAAVADGRSETDLAREWRGYAGALREAVEATAWDGEWYRRAYFDDGTPLGSAGNDECRIDGIAQSWAVIAGGDPHRAAAAMDAADKWLVRRTDRLLLLFDPPFDAGPLRPGYVKGYLPGVRENGGQYTHAATWAVKALAMLGRGDEAHAAFDLLNPIRMPADVYKGEPYVLAGDVYSHPPHTGRAGWTWYTGSCGWLYRVGLEDIIGLRRVGNTLRFDPCVPATWEQFTVRYHFGRTVYRIEFHNSNKVCRGVPRVSLDGRAVESGVVELTDTGGERLVRVELDRMTRDGAQAGAQPGEWAVPAGSNPV